MDRTIASARSNRRGLRDKVFVEERWFFAVAQRLHLPGCSIPMELFARLGTTFLLPNLVGALSNRLFVVWHHRILPVNK